MKQSCMPTSPSVFPWWRARCSSMKTNDCILRWSEVLLLAAALLLGTGFAALAESPKSDTNAPSAVKLTDDQMGEMLQAAVLMAQMGLYDEAEARCRQIL